MGVFIKNMKLPINCHMCVAGFGGFCHVSPPETDGECPHKGKPKWCPMISVPEPHGRLIDADALFRKVYDAYGINVDESEANYLLQLINDAQTVIPEET